MDPKHLYEDINGDRHRNKAIFVQLVTGSDVDTRQVVYKQGGGGNSIASPSILFFFFFFFFLRSFSSGDLFICC